MAFTNFLNIITDDYNPSVIDSLFDNYGATEDGFSGGDGSLMDMNAAAWLVAIAIKKKDDAKVGESVSKILNTKNENGIPLYKETNQNHQNTLFQVLQFYKGSNKVTPDDIYNYYLNTIGVKKEEVKEMLKSKDSNGVNAIIYFMNTKEIIKSLANNASTSPILEHKDLFNDNNEYTSHFPIATLLFRASLDESIRDDAEKIIEQLISSNNPNSRFELTDKIFYKFNTDTTKELSDTLSMVISALPVNTMEESLENFILPLLEKYMKPINNDAKAIINSISFSKTIGFTFLETGFSYSAYKNKSKDYEPILGPITAYLTIKTIDINYDLIKSFFTKGISNAFTFPFNNTTNTGLTVFSMLSNLYDFKNPSVKLEELLSYLFKTASNDIPFDSDENSISKLYKLNAVTGSIAEFTEGAQINMYGPIYILFNKINKEHKEWCDKNDKNFNDYNLEFDKTKDKLFNLDYITFDGYKKWCQTFGKDF